MLINYFKVAWRNLFKNKLHTGINIGGLIVGFTIGIFVIMTVYWQLNADKFHKHFDQLFQTYQFTSEKEGPVYGSHYDHGPRIAFKNEVPSIDKITVWANGGSRLMYGERQLNIANAAVDADFLMMFSFPLVKSSKANPLSELTDVVITESTAKQIFGSEEPVGKKLKVEIGGQFQDLTVSAVAKDMSGNSSLKFDVLVREENRPDFARGRTSWTNSFQQIYVKLKDGATQAQAEKELRQVVQKYIPSKIDELKASGAKADVAGDLHTTRLLPMGEVHFSKKINGGKGASLTQVYAVLTIGLLIILIASFNFININLANAFSRTKEIGVRKCLGAAKSKLFTQLWSESFLVCLIAFGISLFLANVLIEIFKNRLSIHTSFTEVIWKPDFLLLGFVLLLLVSLIAGGYPSWVMMRFKVVETLKGNVTMKRKSILRSSLIVAQFVIACVMISSTYIIYQQFQHLQNADLGFQTSQLISIPLSNPDKGHETIDKLRMRLANNPQIVSISGSNVNIGRGRDRATVKSNISFDYKERQISTAFASIDYDYAKTLGLKMIEGRDFDKSFAGDSTQNVILSEAAAKQYGAESMIGKTIKVDSGSAGWHVIGIFPDFHMYSMRQNIEPLTLMFSKSDRISYCFVRTSSNNLVNGMKAVQNAIEEIEPGTEFRGSYVEENVNRWYEEEKMMSIVFSISSVVSIILSCMGLLAMVLLVIQQRLKEIGVRKVLGASVQSISVLISREFVKLVLIAVIISTPIAWMIMNAWLQDFPYRIAIQWWMFGLVAISAVMISFLTIGANTIKAARQNPIKNLRTE